MKILKCQNLQKFSRNFFLDIFSKRKQFYAAMYTILHMKTNHAINETFSVIWIDLWICNSSQYKIQNFGAIINSILSFLIQFWVGNL